MIFFIFSSLTFLESHDIPSVYLYLYSLGEVDILQAASVSAIVASVEKENPPPKQEQVYSSVTGMPSMNIHRYG